MRCPTPVFVFWPANIRNKSHHTQRGCETNAAIQLAFAASSSFLTPFFILACMLWTMIGDRFLSIHDTTFLQEQIAVSHLDPTRDCHRACLCGLILLLVTLSAFGLRSQNDSCSPVPVQSSPNLVTRANGNFPFLSP